MASHGKCSLAIFHWSSWRATGSLWVAFTYHQTYPTSKRSGDLQHAANCWYFTGYLCSSGRTHSASGQLLSREYFEYADVRAGNRHPADHSPNLNHPCDRCRYYSLTGNIYIGNAENNRGAGAATDY